MLFFTLLLWKKGYISGDPLFYSGTFIWNMMLVQISFHPPLPPSCETRWKNIHFSNECGREPQKLPSGCFWMLRMRYLITILYFMFLMYLCIMIVATYIRTYTIYYLYIHLVLASQESSNICRSWGQRFMPGICCFSLRFATIFSRTRSLTCQKIRWSSSTWRVGASVHLACLGNLSSLKLLVVVWTSRWYRCIITVNKNHLNVFDDLFWGASVFFCVSLWGLLGKFVCILYHSEKISPKLEVFICFASLDDLKSHCPCNKEMSSVRRVLWDFWMSCLI